MTIIHSRHDICLTAPESIRNTPDAQLWLASMIDASWHTLTDFRNWPHWVPRMHGVKEEDSMPPARGSLFQVDTGQALASCTIDRWDPPSSLHISMNLGSGEVAYGITIEPHAESAEIRILLDLERSLTGLSSFAAFFLRWQLQRQGRQMLTKLVARVRSANKPSE